jgi:hypothetical protein
MPIESALVVAAAASMFTVFGMVLAWGARQTSGRPA